MTIRALVLEYFHLPSGTIRWEYLCQPVLGGYATRAGDTPSRQPFRPLLEVAVEVEVQVSTRGEVGGSTRINVKEAVLSNPFDAATGTRPLDHLATDAVLPGWPVHEYELDPARPWSEAVLRFRGVVDDVQPDGDRLRVAVTVREGEFDAAVLSAVYAAGEVGVGAEDLVGRRKEGCFGRVAVAEPTWLGVVGGLHTYSIHPGRIGGVDGGLVDEGSALTLVAGTPGAGEWSLDPLTGRVTVGSGRLKAPRLHGVRGAAPGGVFREKAASLIAWLAEAGGIVTGGEIDAAAVAAADVAAPQAVGAFLPAGDTTTYRQLFDRLCAHKPWLAWMLGATGTLWIGTIPRPTGTPVRTLLRDRDHDGLRSVWTQTRYPAKRVTLRYAPHASPFAPLADTAAGLVDLLSKPWREVTGAEDAAIATAWRSKAREVPVETALALRSEAEALLPEWQDELGDPPQAFRLTLRDRGAGLAVRQVVAVQDRIAGFGAPRLVTIVGGPVVRRDGTSSIVVRT